MLFFGEKNFGGVWQPTKKVFPEVLRAEKRKIALRLEQRHFPTRKSKVPTDGKLSVSELEDHIFGI